MREFCTAQDGIAQVLDSCLLTPAEMALGSAAWAEWPCPWDVLDV